MSNTAKRDEESKKCLDATGCDAKNIFECLIRHHVEYRDSQPEFFGSKAAFQSQNVVNTNGIDNDDFDTVTITMFNTVSDICERKVWTRDVLKLVRDYIKLHEKLRDAAQEKLIEGSWRKQTDDEIKLGRQTSSSSYKRWGDEFLKCLAAQKILDTALPPEPKGDAAPKKAATKKAATKKAATKKAATKSRGQARSQRGTQT